MKQFHKMRLLGLRTNTLQFEDFAEVSIGEVGNMDEIGLDKCLWW